jgi:hypothetical protein
LTAKLPLHLDSEYRRRCLENAAGNPGYLELLVAHASRDNASGQFPPDLIALVDDRLAAISPEAAHTLLALAVFGDVCTPHALASLTGLAKYELLASLEELEFGSLIRVAAHDVRCRSELLRDRVLARAAKSVVALLHGRAAQYLERARDTKHSSQGTAWRVAEHWQAAGSVDRARKWQQTCWRHAIAIGQPLSAAAGIRQALSNSRHPVDRALLLDELTLALQSAGEHAARLDTLTERLALSKHCNDSAVTRRALEFDLIEASLSNYDAELPYLTRLQAFVRSRRLDPARRIRAARALMIIAHNLLDQDTARSVFETNRTVTPPDRQSALLHGMVSLIFHTVFGKHDEAIQLANQLRAMALQSPDSWQSLGTLIN